eukprot:gene9643-biopygen9849
MELHTLFRSRAELKKHAADRGSRGHSAKVSLKRKDEDGASRGDGKMHRETGQRCGSRAGEPATARGIERNEKQGAWKPAQLVEHAGLEVDASNGQFKVALSADRKDPGRREAPAEHSEPCVAVGAGPGASYLQRAVPVGPLSRAPESTCGSSTSPTTARRHTDSSLFAWGRLYLKKPARVSVRGFWGGDELGCHITHLALAAIARTVQTFLKASRGRAVLLRPRCTSAGAPHFEGRGAEAEDAETVDAGSLAEEERAPGRGATAGVAWSHEAGQCKKDEVRHCRGHHQRSCSEGSSLWYREVVSALRSPANAAKSPSSEVVKWTPIVEGRCYPGRDQRPYSQEGSSLYHEVEGVRTLSLLTLV